MNVTINFFSKIKSKYYISIIILHILFISIKCQSEQNTYNSADNTCDANCNECKPSIIYKSCYHCSGINTNFYVIENETCKEIQNKNQDIAEKVIYGSNECVKYCPSNTWELGDFCYLNIEANMEKVTEIPFKTLKCKYTYNKTQVKGFTKYECFNNDIKCSTNYYDGETNECISESECNNKFKKEENGQTRCTSKCFNDEFTYELDNKKQCLESDCNNTIYYYKRMDGKYCVKNCENDDIFDISNGCVAGCDNNSIIVYNSTNDVKTKKCFNKDNINDYYYYNDIYFVSCLDTKILFNKTTYKYEFNNIKKCVELCSLTKKSFLNDSECVSTCEETDKKYYYDNKCFSGCSDTDKAYYTMNYNIIDNNEIVKDSVEVSNINYKKITINFTNYQNPYECLEKCPIGTYIDNDLKQCFITSCFNGKFINSKFECIKTCDNQTEGYLFNETVNLKIIKNSQVGQEEAGGTRYLDGDETNDEGKETEPEINYEITKRFCLSSCPNSAPYHDFDNNICYDIPCKERNKLAAYDNPYICYNHCQDIKNDNYNYENNFICYKTSVTCDEPYYYIDNNGFKKCAGYNECKEKGYQYIREKECVNNCNSTIYYSYKDNNNLGECFLDPNDCIKKEYNYFNNIDKMCKKECDLYKISDFDSNLIKNEEGETCFSYCPKDYPYRDNNTRLCLKNCPTYFYGKECLNNCSIINKPHFYNSYECVDNCKKNDIDYYEIENNNEKICYYSCPDEYPFREKEIIDQIERYKCVFNCSYKNRFYYEDVKICRESCNLYNSKEPNDTKCVYECPSGLKIDNGYCVKECPNTAPKIKKELISNKIVETCTNECPKMVSNSTNYCLDECNIFESYEYEKKCYEKCPDNTFADDLSKSCSLTGCPSGLKYYQIINGVKECKLSCPSDKYSLEKGGECTDYCPKEYNFIGGNNLCINKCNYTYGEYYQEIDNQNNLEYKIYKCVQICDDDQLIVNDTKECINDNKCPTGYYKSPNNICYKSCDLDPDNPFTTKNDKNESVCAKKCHNDEPNYGKNKICKKGCSDLIEEISNITDYDGACVSECKNPLYKYLQNWECVKECTTNYIIEEELKCVNVCTPPYNYIEDNKCKKKCENNPFEKEITQNGIKIIQCVEKCDDNQFYYKESKKCLSQCEGNDYIIQDEHICVSFCPSSYYIYVPDGLSDSTYFNYSCVSKCPNEKPFIDIEDKNSKKCLRECKGNNKYHNDNDTICISKCGTGTIEDNYICRSSCPNNTFFNDNKCINKCPPEKKFYVPFENECLEECKENLYRTDGEKCVLSCNETSYYLAENNTCMKYCPSDFNYILKFDNLHVLNNFIPNTCFKDCPEQYPYFINETISDNNVIHICKNDCDYKGEKIQNSIKCLDFCEEFNFYDKEKKQCNSTACPNDKPYYIEKQNGNITYYECYEICTKDFPFINGSQCVKKCDKYSDYESKKCVDKCNDNQKEFYDNDNNVNYCLNNCTSLGLFEDGDNCVKECNSTRNLISNMATKTCECENLFYIEDNQKMCVPSTNKKCPNNYPYRKYQNNECFKNCIGVLSVNQDFCYDNCSENTYPDNNNICQCSYNYYKDKNNQIICLGENVECPSNYPLLIEKECVSQCNSTYNIQYDGKCLTYGQFDDVFKQIIGSSTDIIKLDCTCNICYYSGGKYICDTQETCPVDNPYYIKDLKKCVNNCSDSQYFILDLLNGKKDCVSSCNNTYSYINNINNYYECMCKNKWYKDGNQIECAENDEINCATISGQNDITKYIKKTNECVNACNGKYSYFFNNECFSSCDEARNVYGYNVKNDSKNIDSKECICENLWILKNNNEKECIKENICTGDNNLLVYSTNECRNECYSTQYIFNNICYEECPSNTKKNTNTRECECLALWYNYKDQLYNQWFKFCLSEDENECPSHIYPYLNLETKQCVQSQSNCTGLKIFNYKCYKDSCPENTIEDEESGECICDPKKPWYQYIKNEKKFLECNVENCPDNKNKLDTNTNECKTICNDEQYFYKDNCYDKCPDNTRLIDEISKECIEILAFDEAKNLSNLEEIIKTDIINIYPTTSKGGLVYNINNSTLQIYGVNKKKTENKELIMRSNLTYIDLSNCIDKLYEKNGLTDETDIIIVKYDIGDKTNTSTINPVEFKIINSKTGQEIPLDACEDNSIIISYPLSAILNNFIAESYNLRNLEEEKFNKNLNLKEKFLKGKDIYLENEEIDSFNYENKLYTDMCYPCEINGKDLILEDRFNYLFPLFSFCESNCIYNKTDFILERVICNCSPKDGVNFERTVELENINADIKQVKDKQKGSIFKCIGKISKISKNFGFYYGLIIILVVIGMGLLTLLYSYKVLIMRIKIKFEANGNNIINNNDTENIENSNLNEDNNNRKKTEDIIKTSERNLENPPKKSKKLNIIVNNNDKKEESKKENKGKKDKKDKKDKKQDKKQDKKDPEVININKLKINKNKNEYSYEEQEDKISYNYNDVYYEKNSIPSIKEMDDENIFELVKMEKKLLTIDYNNALRKNKAEIIVMILTEILDKIYIIKAIWLLQEYELFSLYFSLYLLWHMLTLSFLSLFYNNNTLQKIWTKVNYPDLNYYLSFGFVACIISFIFYRGLYFLINNEKNIKDLAKEKDNKDIIGQKYNKMMFWLKIKIIIFYAVEFILLIIFFLYLISFCGVYNATSLKLVESYGIALIEIVIIKVLYGLVLGILRKISLSYEINILYNIVRILDLYIS